MLVISPTYEPSFDNLRGPVRDTPVSDEPPTKGVPNSLLAKIAIARAICGCPLESKSGFFGVPGVPASETIGALYGLVENSFPGSNTRVVRIANRVPNTKAWVIGRRILRAIPGALARDEPSTVILENTHHISGANLLIEQMAGWAHEGKVSFVLCWDDTHERARKIDMYLKAVCRNGATLHGLLRFGHYPEVYGAQFAQMCCGVLCPEWHPPVWVYGRLAYWACGSVRRLRLYAELLHNYHVHVGQRNFTPLKVSQYLGELAAAFFDEKRLDFAEALGDRSRPKPNVRPLNWQHDSQYTEAAE